MKYSVIIFDWDGTLMDSTANIVIAIQNACKDLGFMPPPKEKVSWIIGLSLSNAIHHILPDLSPELFPKFAERYQAHYFARDQHMHLFEGIPELLNALTGKAVRLAVATGKGRKGLNRALSLTGLESTFHATRCAEETFSKPHPSMVHELIEELGTTPSEVLVIGDTLHDMQMAVNAGVHGLGVTYGAHSKEELDRCESQGIMENISALQDWLLPRVKAFNSH